MTSESTLEERRLWIGNLDTRLSEFQLLKILQKCGNIEKFDLLFHKNGPLAGQPRGYAFVTYKTTSESVIALQKLHGKLIGTKNVAVRLAKNINYDELEKPKPKIEIPVLAAGSSKDNKVSRQVAIQAIEAKLRSLESRHGDDFEINRTAASEVPLIQKYQFNKNLGEGSGQQQKQYSNSRQQYSKNRHTTRPYNKNRPHRR